MIASVVVVTVMFIVSLYITMGMIKYNTQIKKNERHNKGVNPIINQERYNLKSRKEAPKDKVQNKRKPGRPKKKVRK
jgi:hypothetical protein